MTLRQNSTDAKTQLRIHHLKATPGRLLILDIFNRARQPLATQEIIDLLPRTDRATIYRTITSLKTNGIIKQIDLRQNYAQYELVGVKEHHHLVCLRCGRIEDVRHCNIENIQDTIIRSSKHFAEIRQHALEFYGVCKSCVRKNENEKTSTEIH